MISDTAAPYSLSLFTSEMDVVQSIVLFLGGSSIATNQLTPVSIVMNCTADH